jgi:hypothetical protein
MGLGGEGNGVWDGIAVVDGQLDGKRREGEVVNVGG